MNEMYRRRKAPRRKAKVLVRFYRRRVTRRLQNPPPWLYVIEMITVVLLATMSLFHDEESSVLLHALLGLGS